MQLAHDTETLDLTEAYGFDRELFEQLRNRLIRGELNLFANRVQGTVEPPHDGDIVQLADPSNPARAVRSVLPRYHPP